MFVSGSDAGSLEEQFEVQKGTLLIVEPGIQLFEVFVCLFLG